MAPLATSRTSDRPAGPVGRSYARLLLVQVDGELDRLLAVAAEARRKHAERGCPWQLGPQDEDELIAVELAEHAARIVRGGAAA